MNIRCWSLIGLLALGACAQPMKEVAAPTVREGIEALNRKDFELAVANFAPLARQGDAVAEMRLGYLYVYNPDPRFDSLRGEGAELIKKAAAQGNLEAELRLGDMYREGRAVPLDLVESTRWYRAAADRDDAGGEDNLGFAYDTGRGVAADPVEAVRFTARAAEQGAPYALRNIGYYYREGRGVPKSPKDAAYWYAVANRFAQTDALKTNTATARDKELGQIPVAEAKQIMEAALSWTPGKGSLDQVRRDAHIPVSGG